MVDAWAYILIILINKTNVPPHACSLHVLTKRKENFEDGDYCRVVFWL